MDINLIKGKRYSAKIELGWIDRLASNDQVAKKFESVGFTNVQIVGDGKHRIGSAEWQGNTMLVNIPSQIVECKELN